MIDTIKKKVISTVEEANYIVEVYDFQVQGEVTGFPYACVIWNGEEAVEITNRQDRISDQFEITLVQEKLEQFKGRSEAEQITNDRTDDILGKFREDYTLGGLVIKTTPIKIEKNYDSGSTRIIIKIIIKTDRLVDITT